MKTSTITQYNVISPCKRIAIDIARTLPGSRYGSSYIIFVINHFSNWLEADALPNREAYVLMKNWIHRYGEALELHTNQGQNLESALFQDLCKILRIKETKTTYLHLQSDGISRG